MYGYSYKMKFSPFCNLQTSMEQMVLGTLSIRRIILSHQIGQHISRVRLHDTGFQTLGQPMDGLFASDVTDQDIQPLHVEQVLVNKTIRETIAGGSRGDPDTSPFI
ncbi:Transposase IS4 [Popillia japonica]|uniref:Transposase IS4 n=1 Tax=Popillia japonica TaxID=7064 RepID=A0AAW1IDK1_POPJA